MLKRSQALISIGRTLIKASINQPHSGMPGGRHIPLQQQSWATALLIVIAG
jgi:hypothetical protein